MALGTYYGRELAKNNTQRNPGVIFADENQTNAPASHGVLRGDWRCRIGEKID